MKLVYFTLTKYFELASLAVVNFLLAEVIGPVQLGKLIPILLFITYSSFAPLGSPQLILRYYELKKTTIGKYNLIVSANKLIWIGIVTILISSFLLIEPDYIPWVCLISISTVLSSYLMAKSRVAGNLTPLNIANLSFACTLVFANIIFVNDVLSYLKVMAISRLISLVILILAEPKFFKQIFISIGDKIRGNALYFYTKKSIQMMVNGLLITLLMSIDRIFIQSSSMELELQGSYQLADMIATAAQMLLSSILVYYFHIFLLKLRRDAYFKKKYLQSLLIATITICITLPISFLLTHFININAFSDYERLWLIIPYLVHWKLIILTWSSLITYYTAIGSEIRALLITSSLIIALFILSIVTLSSNLEKPELIPVVYIGCTSLWLFFVLIKEMYQNAKTLH